MQTYCGKDCAFCTKKEQLACPGCKTGPGRSWYDGCEIARCCKTKSHESCDTCINVQMCGKRSQRDGMAEQRIRKQAAVAREQEELARKAPFLGRWLWILFWLIVPSLVAGLIGSDFMVGLIPALRWPGEILSLLCSLARGLVLLKLAAEERRYRTAGILLLITAAVNLVTAGVSGAGGMLLLTLPAAILALVAQYHLYTGHAEVLRGVDYRLMEQWSKLWKWTIASYGVTIGSIFLMLVAPRLGLLVMVAAMLALIVVSILEMVYLYRTAKCFR